MTDFDRLLDLLRGGSVPPDELARLARIWEPDRDPPFLDFVAGPVTASAGVAGRPWPADADATATYAAPARDDASTPPLTPPPEPDTPGRPTAEFHPGQPRFPLPPPPAGGRYVPLRLHRHGGLGVVFVARDTAVGREVALKTIRPDRRAGATEADAFVREAQLTGRLEHPCVVPVYDLPAPRPGAGPCYVMRFVAGRTLAEAAAAYHAARAAGAADPLALAGLLDAVVAVARAVGFAHGKGVLHRDLKGQNVVLGDHGEVFLLDWGLALDEADEPAAGGGLSSGWAALPDFARLTPPRSAAGTPGFMAPEVVEHGGASRAADVYGLGGVLYQVLAGRAPYVGTNNEDILRQVKESDPQPVREVNPAVPPALAAVCHKALARDPAARYASADDFATDLRRFLADEPVAAYREPWAARAARWARRHRTGVVAAAAVLLVTAVGSAVAAGLVWREKERTAAEFVRAEGEWQRAEAERERAEGHYSVAGGLAFELSERISRLETGLANQQARDRERKAALDAARAAFDRLLADRPADPTLRRRAAALHRYAANLARFLADPGADAAYTASLRLAEPLAAETGDPTDLDVVVQTLSDLAAFQVRAGRLADATKTLDRAAARAGGLDGRIPPSAFRRTTGVLELDRAEADRRLGRFDAAADAAGRAAAKLDALATAPKGEVNPVDPLLAAGAHHQRALALRELGRTKEARDAFDAAVERADGGAKGSRDARHYANRTRLGRAAADAADPKTRDRAAAELDGVIERETALAAEFQQAVVYKELLAEAHLVRGELTTAAGRGPAAAADFKAALDLTRKLVDENGQLADHVALRGRVYLAMGKAAATPAEAAAPLKLAVQVLGVAARKDPENVLVRRWLADAERAAGGAPR